MFWFILICQHLCVFNDPENFSRKFSNVSYHNYQSCLWLICCLEEPFATLRLSFSMCLFSLPLECSPVQLHYVKQIKSHSLQHRLSFQHYLDKRYLLGTYQNIFLFFWKQIQCLKHYERSLERVLAKTQLLTLFQQVLESISPIGRLQSWWRNSIYWILCFKFEAGIIKFIVNIQGWWTAVYWYSHIK